MSEIINAKTVNVERNSFYLTKKDVWWDLNGELTLLNRLDARVLNYIKEVFQKHNLIIGNEGFQLPKNLSILDVGCGGGILTEPLARAGANVLGIDVNKIAIEAAQDHAKLDPCLKNIQYRWESIEEHSQQNINKYDVVILNFVLQHAKNHETLLKDCVKTLKPGGIIFASSLERTYESWIRVCIMGALIFRHFPRGGFNWYDFINCSDVKKILTNYRCDVEDVKYLYYDMFSSKVKWTDNTNGFYILHAVKN